MNSKKILIISPIPTHPQNTGARARLFNMADNLKKMGHNVYFACEDREREAKHVSMGIDENGLKNYWGKKYFFIPFRPKLNFLGKILREAKTLTLTRKYLRKLMWTFLKDASALSYPIDYIYNENLDSFAKEITKSIKFDAVIVVYVWLSKVLENFSNNELKIIDTNDVFTDRNKKYIKNGIEPGNFFSITKEQEAKGLNRADIIIAIQDNEKKLLETITDKKVITIGHFTKLKRQNEKKQIRSLFFVGTKIPANIQAVNFLAEKIFPELKKTFEDAQLTITGSVGEIFKNQKLSPGIKITGELQNLEEIYDLSDIVISPLFVGTGLKIKNIEALGYSKPLITTFYASQGLEPAISKAVFLAEKPEDFISKIKMFFLNPGIYNKASAAAYEFAKNYNEKVVNQLKDILNKS